MSVEDPAIARFLALTKTAFLNEADRDESKRRQLLRIVGLMSDLTQDKDQAGLVHEDLPVYRYFGRAIELANSQYSIGLADALRGLQHSLVWAQNPRYNSENRGVQFMNNYGYCDLGLTGNPLLSIGLLMLGPNTTYPLSRFQSEGGFLIIGGTPEWQAEDSSWRSVKPGDVISRSWNGAEGKRTLDNPMLALYAWLYEPTTTTDELE